VADLLEANKGQQKRLKNLSRVLCTRDFIHTTYGRVLDTYALYVDKKSVCAKLSFNLKKLVSRPIILNFNDLYHGYYFID
jgi:hypothetical protein